MLNPFVSHGLEKTATAFTLRTPVYFTSKSPFSPRCGGYDSKPGKTDPGKTKQSVGQFFRQLSHRWKKNNRNENHSQARPTLISEYTYCQLLEAVTNPLGLPDTRPGFSPAELADYVREVFNIDVETHKRCLKAIQANKPSAVCVCATVVEAKDLKPCSENAACDPYCVLQVTRSPPKGRNSPRVSPKSSPKGSPRSSPTSTRRHSSLRVGIRETHAVRSTSCPSWNTELDLPVSDLQTDVLHLSIWDDNLTSLDTTDSPKQPTARRSLRSSFMKHFHRNVSGEKSEGCLGQIKVSLKDVPVLGSDKWYDLYEDSKQRKPISGQCRIKLQLCTRRNHESAESEQCSTEDFCQVIHRVYDHAFAQTVSESAQAENWRPLFSELPPQSRVLLDQFAVQNHFPEISQKLLELCVLLEARCDSTCICEIDDSLLRTQIDSADTLWIKRQSITSCYETQGLGNPKDNITQTEITLLEHTTMMYIDFIADKVYLTNTLPKLFPPLEIQIEHIKQILGVSKKLLGLCHKLCRNEVQNKLTTVIKEKIKADCESWWDLKLNCVRSVSKDAIISEVKIYTGVVKDVMQHTTPCFSVSQYFLDMNVNYEKSVTMYLQSHVALKAQELMMRIDDYQKQFLRHRSNILDSSIASQQLYAALRNYLTVIKSHFTMRGLYHITMIHYQDWFRSAITCWLQTFREEGMRRVVKALDIEKDPVQVTERVKISTSAVDVVAIFVKIYEEWNAIDYQDADIALLGTTKITELICDGVKLYTERIEDILEHNGYYDFIVNEQFDVTDQLCITLNNIVHVVQHLRDLPNRLKFEDMCQNLSAKHDQNAGQRSLQTLERLICSTREDVISKAKILLSRIGDLMEMDFVSYTKKFTQSQPNKPSSVDALLDYLRTNLAVFYEKMDSYIMPHIIEDLWIRSIAVFTDTLMKGQKPEYYSSMHRHLENLVVYFDTVGLQSMVKDCTAYQDLVEKLLLNKQSTCSLMLDYYADLTKSVKSPACYYGHLEAKIAYQLETDATKSLFSTNNNNKTAEESQVVTVFVNVCRAKHLPPMNKTEDGCDAFVSLSLCPISCFPVNRTFKTPTRKNTLDPLFDVTYQYQGIPKGLIEKEGASLLLTVWHKDPVLPCRYYIGEVVLPLNTAHCLDPLQCIDDIPASICPLVRPEEPVNGPFKVLVERQDWDKSAKDMVSQRRLDTGMIPEWPLCRPVTFILGMITTKRSEVKGQPKHCGPLMLQRLRDS